MGNNLKRLREERGWTLEKAAEALGLSRSGYIKIERSERGLNTDRISKAAEVYGVPESEIFSENSKVPIIGYVGAGALIESDHDQTIGGDDLDRIDLPFSVPDGIGGLKVRGVSMLPVYRPDDVILVWTDQRLATDSYIGEEAAVKTSTGLRYLKEIQRGARRGLYNLHSHNDNLIENVGLEWVGEIYLIVRASQMQRILRQKRAAEQRRSTRRTRETEGMDELPLDEEGAA